MKPVLSSLLLTLTGFAATMLMMSGPAAAQAGPRGTVTVMNCRQAKDSPKAGLCTITNNTAETVVSVEFMLLARRADTGEEVGSRISRVRLFGGLQPGEQIREKVSWPALPDDVARRALRHELNGVVAWNASDDAVFDTRP